MSHTRKELGALQAEGLLKKKGRIDELLKHNILVSPEFLAAMENEDNDELKGLLQTGAEQLLVVKKDVGTLIRNKELNVNWL